jgi:Tol biopolymer transport system component
VRVTLDFNGSAGGAGGLNSSASANGRFVAFQSDAADHVQGDLNGTSDVFVRDVKKGVTTRLSVSSAGVESNGPSYNPRLSANGRYVIFQSAADNLLAEDDGNEKYDVFLHDRKTGTTTRVSVSSAGGEAGEDCFGATVSSNGRYVAFLSAAEELVAGDLNGTTDVFLHDRKLGTTVRVSVDAAGSEADGASTSGMISANGRYVVFASVATNLVGDDGSSVSDVFVRDLKLGTVERLSIDEAGDGGDGGSGAPTITANGRYVVFDSGATDLVALDGNGDTDVFLANRKLGTLRRVSVDSAGAEVDGPSTDGVVSSNGRYVAFQSDSEDLAAGDDNEDTDVFLKDLK